MSIKFPKSYYLIFAVVAFITALIVYWGTSRIADQEKKARALDLEHTNKEAAAEFRDALNTYATLISGLKSYIEVTDIDITEDQVHTFLTNQLSDLSADPPFSVSYIDTNHIIRFDIVMPGLNTEYLVGTSMEKIIGKEGIIRMDTLMREDRFYASEPTNLLEGRVGLPLGFGILDEEGRSRGYITSVAEFAPIVERVYSNINQDEFVLKFQCGNGNYFDRTRSYNGQKVYAKTEDSEYFKNFEVPEDQYISTSIPFYNKEFTVSTAYKKPYKRSIIMFVTSFVWYLAILGFMLFLITQYYIYERKNRMIAAQKKRLSELVATKNKFFSIIAHDLRSPLSSVINFLDILKGEEFKNKQTTAIINSLEDSSRNSISLLDNLLKWSKLQTGQIKYEPRNLDITMIIKDQIKIHQEALESKGINVRLESSFKGHVFGDKNMIATTIRNLISNAIKFSYDNDIVVIELNRVDNNFVFSIEDNGMGIPDTFQSRLLDLTVSTVQSGTRNEKGSGLGLILCHEFIKTHKGNLTVESEEGKGTIVTFTIPLKS